MFTSKEQLKRRTGPDGVGRYEFLRQLIVEFTTTRSPDAKYQTLANLANFAYDTVNFEFLKQLHCIDLFLAQLSENDEVLIHFGLSGICNLAPDPECRDYIVKLNGIRLVSQKLWHNNEDIALNALTTLFYLFVDNKHLITPEIIETIKQFENKDNPRFKNLAILLLENVTG